jgi:hypothetical protein
LVGSIDIGRIVPSATPYLPLGLHPRAADDSSFPSEAGAAAAINRIEARR